MKSESLISSLLLKIICLYQKYLSPDHSGLSKYYPHGYCKFCPTCSEYTRLSIIKYGAIKGLIKGTCRIIRCNPLSKGGDDLP